MVQRSGILNILYLYIKRELPHRWCNGCQTCISDRTTS